MKKLPLIRFQLSGLRWSLLLALLGLIIAFNLIASNHVLFKELVNSSHCFVFFLATLLLLQQSTTRDEPNSLFYQ